MVALHPESQIFQFIMIKFLYFSFFTVFPSITCTLCYLFKNIDPMYYRYMINWFGLLIKLYIFFRSQSKHQESLNPENNTSHFLMNKLASSSDAWIVKSGDSFYSICNIRKVLKNEAINIIPRWYMERIITTFTYECFTKHCLVCITWGSINFKTTSIMSFGYNINLGKIVTNTCA